MNNQKFRLLKHLYPPLSNIRYIAHQVTPKLVEKGTFVLCNVREITLVDLATLLFLGIDALSMLCEVFGDWNEGVSLLFVGHRLKIDHSYIDIFPFPCYIYRNNFIVHIPYMKQIPGAILAEIFKGLGYNVYSILEDYASFDKSRFVKVSSGLKI